jgi:hypothetical protein
MDRKQVKRGTKAKLYLFRPGGLHDLGRHAVPCHGATPNKMGRINFHRMIGRIDHRSIGFRMNARIGVFVAPFDGAEGF